MPIIKLSESAYEFLGLYEHLSLWRHQHILIKYDTTQDAEYTGHLSVSFLAPGLHCILGTCRENDSPMS